MTPADAPVIDVWHAGRPVPVDAMLSVYRRGGSDPTMRRERTGVWWLTVRTPDGAATLRVAPLRPASGGLGDVAIAGWGAGAEWAVAAAPDLLGRSDDTVGDFHCTHPVLRQVQRRRPGLRVGRSGLVLGALAPAILEQKVTGVEAFGAFATLTRQHGDLAPLPPVLDPDAAAAGVAAMRVPLSPEQWGAIPSWDWHRAEVDGKRSATLLRAVARAGALERLSAADPATADAALRALPGVGAWTSSEVRYRALGDPDAVSVGDYHLSKRVGWALVGRPVDDDGMLELLEPWRGHRYRVVRLVELSGLAPPRRGPRMSVHGHRDR
ncbi:MAG: DNA-3-methyladenine glycosylase family protein [Actinomycetales bacterium]